MFLKPKLYTVCLLNPGIFFSFRLSYTFQIFGSIFLISFYSWLTTKQIFRVMKPSKII